MRAFLVVLLNKSNSAKLGKDDDAQQSRYVRVDSNGHCEWEPFFSRSISHCSIESTWFPFDEQSCSLIYESWKYGAREVNFTSVYRNIHFRSSIFHSADFFPNALWEIVGRLTPFTRACAVCACVYTSVTNLAKHILLTISYRTLHDIKWTFCSAY